MTEYGAERKAGLWYVSQPSRLGGSGKEEFRNQVLEELINDGYDVIHPFNAFPYDHFEGSPHVGREKAMQYCFDLVAMCAGRVIVTGISKGVLEEVAYAVESDLSNTEIVVYKQYDKDWDYWLQHFSNQGGYSVALEQIAEAQQIEQS